MVVGEVVMCGVGMLWWYVLFVDYFCDYIGLFCDFFVVG